jgi:hypothetical protein
MKEDDDNWSTGPMESATTFVATNETDCSDWDSDIVLSQWSEGQFESAAIAVVSPATESVKSHPISTGPNISDDRALAAKRNHIAHLLDQLGELRFRVGPGEFAQMSRTYRAEVEQMQNEVLEYLTRPASTAG